MGRGAGPAQPDPLRPARFGSGSRAAGAIRSSSCRTSPTALPARLPCAAACSRTRASFPPPTPTRAGATWCASTSAWSPTRCPARACARASWEGRPKPSPTMKATFASRSRRAAASALACGRKSSSSWWKRNSPKRRHGYSCPLKRARFGVISDIDDTIVSSHVANKLKMILTAALSNSRTRKPFAGVAAFYRALHAGVNPFFYVSKSPWNLYAPLVEYLEVQGLPLGPLLLRDFGLLRQKEHKREGDRGHPDHLPEAQVHPDRRQRRGGSGDLQRRRAPLPGAHPRDLYPFSEPEKNRGNREAGHGSCKNRLPAGALAGLRAGGGARRGRGADSAVRAARGARGEGFRQQLLEGGGFERRTEVVPLPLLAA